MTRRGKFGCEADDGQYLHDETDNKDAQDVEADYSSKCPLHCLRDALSGIACLGTSNSDNLNVAIRESGTDKSAPPSKEFASTPVDKVGVERPWSFPVPEPKSIVAWTSTKVDHKTGNDETSDKNNLQRGEDEFRLEVRSMEY